MRTFCWDSLGVRSMISYIAPISHQPSFITTTEPKTLVLLSIEQVRWQPRCDSPFRADGAGRHAQRVATCRTGSPVNAADLASVT